MQVDVIDAIWLQPMKDLRKQLVGELGAIANVRVREIRFSVRNGNGMSATGKDKDYE